MKRTLFIFLFLTFKSYSQDITGNWNVVSYEDETVYYNKVKDSIVFRDTVEKDQVELFKQTLESIVFSVTYSFKSNGKYVLNFPALGRIESGDFKIDKLNKTIMMIEDKGKKDELPYVYSNGILFIRMTMEIGFINVGLTKVDN